MRADAVLHGRRKPSLFPLAVVEPRSAVTRLAVSTSFPLSAAYRKEFRDILTQFDFRCIELGLFGGGRKADVLVSGVDAEGHGLLRFPRGNRKLNGEGRSPFHTAFFSLSRMRALPAEQGISGSPRLFKTYTLKLVSSRSIDR